MIIELKNEYKEKKKIQDNRICGQGNDVQMNRKYAGACYKNGVESKRQSQLKG